MSSRIVISAASWHSAAISAPEHPSVWNRPWQIE
jgi:hypothetical protein